MKKEIFQDTQRKHFSYVGKICAKKHVYKYMNLERTLSCLENNQIRFVQPSEWPDEYESRFYGANYDRLGIGKELHPKLFACCFTTKKMSEAAWKVYSYNKNGLAHRCVKFEIELEALRDALSEYGNKNGYIVYECQMDYSLSDKDILSLHKKSSPYYSELFGNFKDLSSYLTLLSIKRKAFSYEEELRYFLIPDGSATGKSLSVDFDCSALVTELSIDSGCSDVELSILKKYCAANKINTDKIKKERLYYCPNNKITIEGNYPTGKEQLLEIIKETPGVSTKELSEKADIPIYSLNRILRKYARSGAIRGVSSKPPREIEWFITE